jgi:DNA-directed RNA polymerase specialized sigma subunit
MEQTQFDFSKNSNLKELDEDKRDNIHRCLVISEATSNNLDNVLKEAIEEDDINKEDKKELKELIKIVNNFYSKLETLNINLEKKRRGLISLEMKKKIYHFYMSGLFSQHQLGRIFGVSQSTVSRVVKQLSK